MPQCPGADVAGVGTLNADDVMPDDLLDHVSLSGSAARMSASASALPPPSEADEDIANLQDLAPDGSAAASGVFPWSLFF